MSLSSCQWNMDENYVFTIVFPISSIKFVCTLQSQFHLPAEWLCKAQSNPKDDKVTLV